MAPGAFARRLTAVLFVCCALAGCGRGAAAVKVSWTIEPSPPIAGVETFVRVTLQDPAGRLLPGARLRLEAHMAHPGMTPLVSDVTERQHGEYVATLRLSMAGDWVFVVTGELADGSRLTREINVPGVRRSAQPVAAARLPA